MPSFRRTSASGGKLQPLASTKERKALEKDAGLIAEDRKRIAAEKKRVEQAYAKKRVEWEQKEMNLWARSRELARKNDAIQLKVLKLQSELQKSSS